ncbi:MAG: hypothetical protein PHC88_03090 [Terrimicrobiaceae bacterium]|nr:hypothetical protein [Terrimicrobiaceae bacterium]
MAGFAAASLLGSLFATTLQPISEDEQIQQSGTIFRGRVEQIDVAREATVRGSAIVSTVRFVPLAVYKGDAAQPVSLKFLGGRLGDMEMKVGGMPEFQVGQEVVLFVSGDPHRACPVVGWGEGSLTVDRRAGVATVAVSPDVAGSKEPAVSARGRTILTGAIELPEFERRLRTRIAELSNKP